jgi:phosphoribosylaminoimidazole-succinocarboxamide synthase
MNHDHPTTQPPLQGFQGVDLPLAGKQSGKVRDWYPLSSGPLPSGRRLLVTTDRLSAFDRILAAVPYKGQVLNQLAAWWFEHTRELIANHMLDVPDPNALVALEVQPFPVEVIVRGYITGVTSTALWRRYSLGEREIYGYRFPEGLRKNQLLPGPIITPTTKGGPTGHDERLTCAEVVQNGYLDASTWEAVQAAALALFHYGQQVAGRAGLVLVDTKYEFGRAPDGTITLIDEVHTPDSSRFWKADTYLARFESGEEPENFDKEFIRLEYAARGYRGEGDAPTMPDALWTAASQRYIAIYEMLTHTPFVPGAYPVGPRLAENLRKAGFLP